MKQVNAFQFGEDTKLFRETAEEQVGAAAFGGGVFVQCLLLRPDKDIAELKENENSHSRGKSAIYRKFW